MTLRATEADIKINIVDRSEAASQRAWQSTFKAGYLEEIARKTGHAKDYSDIVKMLIGALKGSSAGADHHSHFAGHKIFVDLLGLNDL